MEPKKSTMGFYEENPNDNISENEFLFSESFEREQSQNLQEFYKTVGQRAEREHKKFVHNRYILGIIAGLCILVISICTGYLFFKMAGMRIYLLIEEVHSETDALRYFGGFWYFIALLFNTLIGLLYFKKTSAPFNGSNILFFSLFVLSYNLFFLLFCLLKQSQDYWVLIVPILAFWVIMNIKMVEKFNLYHRIKELLKPVLQWRK